MMLQTMDQAAEGYLSLRGLTKRYGGHHAVDRLSLDIPKGELVAFLGPSGCGKTTSLRMIAGLITPTEGRIAIGGRDLTHVPPHERDIGLVFQSYALFPHMTIAKNLAFGLEMRGVGKNEIAQRVREILELVHLPDLADRKPQQLSGGQQQRVALARALIIRPSILLLDEPLSNLDAKLRDDMRTEIRDLQRQLNATAIFVTHDQMEALTMCDRVAVMNHGRLEQLGTPEDLYERPATAFVAGFVGRINRLDGEGEGAAVRIAGIALRTAQPARGPVMVMIRPHRIRMGVAGAAEAEDGPAGNRLEGTLRRAVFAGDIQHFDIETPAGMIAVEQSTQRLATAPAIGSAVCLHWRVDDTLVFGRA